VYFSLLSGCHWWKKQVPHKWLKCSKQSCPRFFSLGSVECQQSSFPYHARKNHQSIVNLLVSAVVAFQFVIMSLFLGFEYETP